LNLAISHIFIFPAPAFQLLPTRDRFVHVVVALPLHETDGVVLIGEALRSVVLVIKNTAMETVDHSNLDSAPRAALAECTRRSDIREACVKRLTWLVGRRSVVDHFAV
jgi:hypothetical protein